MAQKYDDIIRIHTYVEFQIGTDYRGVSSTVACTLH